MKTRVPLEWYTRAATIATKLGADTRERDEVVRMIKEAIAIELPEDRKQVLSAVLAVFRGSV